MINSKYMMKYVEKLPMRLNIFQSGVAFLDYGYTEY